MSVERNVRHVGARQQRADDPAEENIQAVARLEETARLQRTTIACVCDAITNFAATELSLALHGVWFATWLFLNTRLSPWRPFDPFPFSLLTSIVSLEAIFLSLFVLASQNRLTAETDKRAHLDLQVNLLAEQEMTLVLRMLRELCEDRNLTGTVHSDEFRALIQRTDVGTLAEQLEQKLTPASPAPATTATKAAV